MRHTLIPRLGWSLLLLVMVLPDASAERLPVKIFTSADGLGSSFVDYIFRDSRGFMWFCTRDGLSRFDGARFVTYRVGDKNAPPGIETISETKDGSYWLGTTGGFYRIKPTALSVPEEQSGVRQFQAEYIDNGQGKVIEDYEGRTWYVGQDLYLMSERAGKVEFERKSLNLPENPNLPLGIFMWRLAPDGSFWANTNQGLVRRLPDGRVILLQHESSVSQGLAALTVEANGRVWVAWGNEVFVLMPPRADSLPHFNQILLQPLKPGPTISIEPDRPVNLPDQPGQIIKLTRYLFGTLSVRASTTSDGHVWLTSNNDLIEFDGQVFHTYGTAQGLPTGMGEIGEDAAGNLWVGGRSLLRLNRRGLISYNEDDGLQSPASFAINEANDGTIYAVNGDFYLSRFAGRRFLSSRPNIPAQSRALWSSRYAFLSSANEWWILTTEGLFRFAVTNLQKPLAVYDKVRGLAASEAFQIFEDSRGNIWLSQQPVRAEDSGLYRLKKGEDKFYRFTAAEHFPAGKSASSFAEDRQGNLWFGFYEGGLARFANNEFTEFTGQDGLPSGAITDLLIDRAGRLWMTSTFNGVSRIDDPSAAKPDFVSLSTDQGLSSNNARTITEDHDGRIYVGTVRGVDQISPETMRIRHYSINNGLAGDFVVDSHCDRKGDLWFATPTGLSRLTPVNGEAYAPPAIMLGGLQIAGVKQSISALGAAEITRGELTHTQNNFQIDFFGLDFHAGESLRYQFMLEGADRGWSSPSEQRTVSYANLQSGSYRFLVRAVNIDGVPSTRPAVLSFTILPPFWLRWWFITLIGLAVFVLLYWLHRYRMARLAEAKRAEEELSRARRERLVELEQVRKRIATDLHDDIGSSLTRISLLSEVAQRQRDGVDGTSLSTIAGLSRELVDSMSDIVWAINPERDHLGDLTQRMRRFAGDVFSARGIEFTLQLPIQDGDFRLRSNLRREVFLIFKEAVNNTVRHSECTTAGVNFRITDDHQLWLELTDNGRGFDLAPKNDGHGLSSMRARTEALGGQLKIESGNGRGTVLVFKIPLNPGNGHAA